MNTLAAAVLNDWTTPRFQPVITSGQAAMLLAAAFAVGIILTSAGFAVRWWWRKRRQG